jgi:hypothetical protein
MHHLSTIQPLFRIYYCTCWNLIPQNCSTEQVLHFSLGTVLPTRLSPVQCTIMLTSVYNLSGHSGRTMWAKEHDKHEQVVLMLKSILELCK